MKFALWLEKNSKDIDRGAGIFFTDGKNFLALKYTPNINDGVWTLPGGHMQEGETELQAAKREAKEETGSLCGKMFGMIQNFDKKWNCFLFEVEKPFEVKLSDEHIDSKWIDFDDVDKYDWHEPFEELMKQHIDKAKKYFELNENDLDAWYPDEDAEPKLMDKSKFEVPFSQKADDMFGKKIHVWLDDERDPKKEFIQKEFGAKGNEIWVKTATDTIDLLNSYSGQIASISLDHDLGEGAGTGYDVANWIEEMAFKKELQPISDMRVHSANPIGAYKMKQALNNARKYWG